MTCAYTDDENITRLHHALRGPALETVGHLLSFPDGLKDAINTLKAGYGRPDLIVEPMIRKIRGMTAPNAEDLSTLVEFGFAVKRLVGVVKVSGLQAYVYDVTLLKELVKKLSPVICIDWARERKRFSKVTSIEFGKWIGELADDLCSVIDMTSSLERHDGTHAKQLPTQQLQHRQSWRLKFQPARPNKVRPSSTGRVQTTYCNTTIARRKGVRKPANIIEVHWWT